MALRYLLDTDIVIYLQRRRTSVVRRFEQLEPGEAALSVVVYGELRYGAEKSDRRTDVLKDLEDLIRFVPLLAMPPSVGDTYGEIRAVLERAGEVIGGNDLWIAAHARTANLTLVTNNTREFKRIKGLKLENWS